MMYCNTFPDLQEKLLNSNHSNFISTVEAGWCQWKSWMPKQNAWTQKRQTERESHISVRGYICSDLSITVHLNSKLGRFHSRYCVSSCFHNAKHTTGGHHQNRAQIKQTCNLQELVHQHTVYALVELANLRRPKTNIYSRMWQTVWALCNFSEASIFLTNAPRDLSARPEL